MQQWWLPSGSCFYIDILTFAICKELILPLEQKCCKSHHDYHPTVIGNFGNLASF